MPWKHGTQQTGLLHYFEEHISSCGPQNPTAVSPGASLEMQPRTPQDCSIQDTGWVMGRPAVCADEPSRMLTGVWGPAWQTKVAVDINSGRPQPLPQEADNVLQKLPKAE